MRGHRRMILSYGCSDEKIILFFALPGNSIPHLVHLSDRGGLARIATTIRRARAAGPTLICDVGDAVFGAGIWPVPFSTSLIISTNPTTKPCALDCTRLFRITRA